MHFHYIHYENYGHDSRYCYQKYLYDNGLLIEYLWYGYNCSNYEYGCLLYDCEYPLCAYEKGRYGYGYAGLRYR